MSARRFNEILKIVGAFGAALLTVAPMLSQPMTPERIAMAVGGLISSFLAGLATRGVNQEDKDVTEAKVIAKTIAPPAMKAQPTFSLTITPADGGKPVVIPVPSFSLPPQLQAAVAAHVTPQPDAATAPSV